MSIEKLSINQFLEISNDCHIIDVRSENEFIHAHIPGAVNLPLFNNDERKIVGTLYKQQSREHAIKKGLEFFGPKMKKIVVSAENIAANQEKKQKTFIVHCWRGGMRSAAVAWLLDIYGFKVYTIIGGYKAYRNWVLKQFEKNWNIKILGGYTGSGKTIILEEINKLGEAIIDLEGIAGHRGSAFGRIGLPEQTSVEMFENKLAVELNKKEIKHQDKHIWIEDESQRIGAVSIPHNFWSTMRQSKVYFINIPFEERLKNLVETYGKLNVEELAAAIKRIEKKLGGLETKMALEYLRQENISECFSILLTYYDKLYKKSLMNREETYSDINKEKENIAFLEEYKFGTVESKKNATILIKLIYG